MNNALGLQLNMSGLYTDLEDQTFTVPAKNGSVILTLSPKAIPVGGSSIMPIRLAESKKAVIEVFNRGSHIGTAMANKAMTPYKSVLGELIWNGETQLVDAPTMSYLPLLAQLDFTDLFGTPQLLNAAFNAGNRDFGSSGWAAVMNDETRAIVNTRLATVGIPPIDRPTTSVDIVPSDAYFSWAIETMTLTSYYDAYRKTYMGLTAAPFRGMNGYGAPNAGDRGGVAPAHINKAFKYYVRLSPLGGIIDRYTKMPYDNNKAHDLLPINQRPLYLFFNDLM